MDKTYIVYDGIDKLFELDAQDEKEAVEKALENDITKKVANLRIADKQTGYLVFP